jgi:hypothetical protein
MSSHEQFIVAPKVFITAFCRECKATMHGPVGICFTVRDDKPWLVVAICAPDQAHDIAAFPLEALGQVIKLDAGSVPPLSGNN